MTRRGIAGIPKGHEGWLPFKMPQRSHGGALIRPKGGPEKRHLLCQTCLTKNDYGLHKSFVHMTFFWATEHATKRQQTLANRSKPDWKMQLLTHEEIAGTRDIFETSYGELGGISSQTKDSEQQAVNLWTSSFSPPKGKFNYQGVRHGIHSAVDISNPEQRKIANLNRARESLIVDSNGRQTTIRITFRLALFNFGVNKGTQGTFSMYGRRLENVRQIE